MSRQRPANADFFIPPPLFPIGCRWLDVRLKAHPTPAQTSAKERAPTLCDRGTSDSGPDACLLSQILQDGSSEWPARDVKPHKRACNMDHPRLPNSVRPARIRITCVSNRKTLHRPQMPLLRRRRRYRSIKAFQRAGSGNPSRLRMSRICWFRSSAGPNRTKASLFASLQRWYSIRCCSSAASHARHCSHTSGLTSSLISTNHS